MRATFIQQLLQRLGSKSPKFFRKLQIIAGVIGALVWLFNSAVAHHAIKFDNVENLTNWLNTLGGGLVGVVFGALTTTTNPDLLDTEVKQAVKSDEAA